MNNHKRSKISSGHMFQCLICQTSGIMTSAPSKLIKIFQELVQDDEVTDEANDTSIAFCSICSTSLINYDVLKKSCIASWKKYTFQIEHNSNIAINDPIGDDEDVVLKSIEETSGCFVCCENVSNIKQHLLDIHCSTSDENKFIYCNYCNFRSSKTVIIQHLNEFHVLLEPRRCNKCSDVLNSFEEYVTHLNSHKYQTSNEKLSLVRDINGNREEQRPRINICDKSSRHNKKYSCISCGQTFGSGSALNSHQLKSHADDNRPHKCHLCTQRYVHLKNLKNHYRTVHGLEYTTRKIPSVPIL